MDAPHLSSTWISAISQRQDFLPLWKRDIPRAKIRSRERGTVSDYVKTAFPERKSATFFEMHLWGPEETYDPYDSVMIRMQEKFDRKDDKKYSLEYYRRMGIAHENQNGKDYYMVVLER